MEEKEIIEADISMFAKYNRYLSPLPLEAILIQHFKMSFQTGDNSVKLDEAITRMLLKKNTATKAEIFNVVSKDRYYKCIYAVNNIVELAILKELKVPDIIGVKFISMRTSDKKLLATFEILR
jgi:hypothetical protein